MAPLVRAVLAAERIATQAALVAVSGRTGAVLWVFRGQTPGAVVAPVVVTRVDDDGIPDLIALRDAFGPTPCSIEAVSGKTGLSLWRRELDPQWYRGTYTWRSGPNFHHPSSAPLHAAVLQRSGRPLVAVAAGKLKVSSPARDTPAFPRVNSSFPSGLNLNI